MPASKESVLKLVKTQNESARQRGAALADVYKALKATTFYPKGHPLRADNLRHAHASMTNLLNGREILLVITRAGFSSADGGASVEQSPMAHALARELFIRRIQRLVILGDLTVGELQSFLFLLTVDPQKIVQAGGMESLMVRRGLKSIWANEIDLSVIWEKRQALDASEVTLSGNEDEEALLAEPQEETLPADVDEIASLSLEELLEQMAEEGDDNRYLQLARALTTRAEAFKEAGDFADLLPVLEALLDQSAIATKGTIQREYAIFTMEQVAGGKMTDFLLMQLENREFQEPERIHRILRQLGEKVAYVIIQRLCIADGLFARKALATALIRIGAATVAPLVAMLQDDRWYVVRNMVAILGEIASHDCVAALRTTAYHADQRVRKETIRSLVKIGSKEAETIIIGLLPDRDLSIARQAILSLGVMKSKLAVQPLIEIVAERDLFLTSLSLKKDALQAIGRIGDRRATPHLVGLLESRKLVVWNRWEELKVQAAAALGQLGDETALPALKSRAGGSGRLAAVCSEAIDNIERVAVAADE